MESSSGDKADGGDSENTPASQDHAVEVQTSGSDTSPKNEGTSDINTSDNPCEKTDNAVGDAANGETKPIVESGSGDVEMVEGEENGGEGSTQSVDKDGDLADDSVDSPGSKSELVVLDEVEGSLDGKDDDKEAGVDTKTSSNAEGDDSNTKDNQTKKGDDPYAYVRRQDFTSEKFKIEIRGLPRFYGYAELKKFLNDRLKLSSHKMKPTRSVCPGVFVCFRSEEDRQTALKTINRLPWKGKLLTAMTAKPAPDPLVKKRKLENEAALREHDKKPRISDDEKLRNSTTPYWNLSYDEQLQKKYDYVMKIMCKLAEQIMSVNPMLVPWMKRQKAKYKGMACNLLDIRKSPLCDGYRNKCEFTIGIKMETKERIVGFRLGSYVQGHVGVGPIDSLKHIPQRMKDTVKVFEKFIKESDKEPFNPETHAGHWKQLTLRLTTLNELMVIVLVNSKGASDEDLALSKREVKAFFEEGEGKDLKINSLYFQAFGKREAGKEPPKMEHVLGSMYITESIFGLKFRISPEAFFQVNTPGAGILYSTVGEMVELNSSTTIVDVCCGTGTIGLSLAKDCGQVLGLDAVAPAIEDAKVNAVENNVTNVEFFTGRAEEILTSVLTRAKGKSVHAIVDPPRSGLHQKAIFSLRGAEVIDKIIYVSCDPIAAQKNFVDLARITSKSYRGYPMVPVTAIPVDMFPHTAHCEVVILFHRINPINLPKTFPAKDDDITILSKTFTKSPQKSPGSERKEDGASENSGTDNGNTETGAADDAPAVEPSDDINSESVSGKGQDESIVPGDEQGADRQKQRRKRPGRNQRLLARSLLGLSSNNEKVSLPSLLGPKISVAGFGSGPVMKKPAFIGDKPEPRNKIPVAGKNRLPVAGKIVKVGVEGSFRNKIGNKGPFANKPYPKLTMMERNFNPKLGNPGNKRRWRNDDELILRPGDIVIEEDYQQLSPVKRGGPVLENFRERESYPRRGPWKEQGGQRQNMRSRSPPPSTSRDGMGRRNGGGGHDENIWQRLEAGVRNWIDEREGPSGSPARKLMRGSDRPMDLEVTNRDRRCYSPTGPSFREECPSHADDRHMERESRLNGKGFRDRVSEDRFGGMRSERSQIDEPEGGWGKRKRRGSLSPGGRYRDDEFEGRMDNERWGPDSGDMRCENVKEDFSFRRRKHSGEGECGRPNVRDMEERHSRRSCERFNRRSPEMLKRRSSDRFDRRFCARFERRSLERFERASPERLNRRSPERLDHRSSERFDQRSSERYERSPCERCERRSSERLCRPQQQSFGGDVYHEGRQESARPEDFVASRPTRLLQERETVAPKYPQQIERHPERFNEPETQLLVNYRENVNNVGAGEREYMTAASPPRKMVGIIGSVELHRQNEVYVYRGTNDTSVPLPLELERRIPILPSGAETGTSHFEKRYESNVLHRNFDGEEPGVPNDHSVIARRVEVIRRPFVVDDKYGMLLDTSGKSLGTAEVLVVTAKNQMYDGDQRSQFHPNEGVLSSRILEHREMGAMHKPWNVEGSPPATYVKSSSPVNKFGNHPEMHSGRPVDSRPQGNWAFEMGVEREKEMPRPWGDMERHNPVRDQPVIVNATKSKFNSARQDVDDRNAGILSSAFNPGAGPNAQHNMDKPFQSSNYPMQQTGFGSQGYGPEPSSQFPPNAASHLEFQNPIPGQVQKSQNAPFNYITPNNRMTVPYPNMNSSSARPAVFSQNHPSLMGTGMQGTQQLPSMTSKQPLPMQAPIGDVYRQRMPSSVPSSAPDPKMDSWHFKGINPWNQNNQQMVSQRKQW